MGNVFLPTGLKRNASPVIDATGLEGYWRLENNIDDLSGNNRMGFPTGNYSYVEGKLGRAIQFSALRGDSITGSVTVRGPIFTRPTIFSACCWVKKTLPFGVQENILSNRNFSAQFSWILMTGGYMDNTIVLYGNPSSAYSFKSSIALPVDEWVFIGFTVNASKLNLYMNGELVGSYNNFAQNTADTNELTISGYAGGAEGFSGSIDEVSYWSRELTASDVKALYNSGKGMPIF